MNAADHYRKAEEALRLAWIWHESGDSPEHRTLLLADAQVHATLANVGATFLADKQHSYRDAHDALADAVTEVSL